MQIDCDVKRVEALATNCDGWRTDERCDRHKRCSFQSIFSPTLALCSRTVCAEKVPKKEREVEKGVAR